LRHSSIARCRRLRVSAELEKFHSPIGCKGASMMTRCQASTGLAVRGHAPKSVTWRPVTSNTAPIFRVWDAPYILQRSSYLISKNFGALTNRTDTYRATRPVCWLRAA
jgi:hypothetical protein